MDPLAPEFTHTLVRKAMQAIAGMDRVTRPGGIATDEGLSAAVRAGMRHLAAHKGDVRAALAAVKAAGAASADPEPSPPRPWPHGISKAEADRLFVAACHASAREAAQSTEVHARISPDADRNIDSVAVLNPTGSNSLGATIGGVVGEVAAGGLGSESGPLDVLITLAGRYGGRVLGSEIESAIKATESIIVHASADDDSNEGDKFASGQDQSSGSQAQTGGDPKNKRVSSKMAGTKAWKTSSRFRTTNMVSSISKVAILADGEGNK
jgi:outer membrane lipoprotein SlyB